MQKTKLALVSVLSFLVVFAPVSTAVANSRGLDQAKETEKKVEENEEVTDSSVFDEIENHGGNEVSEKRLEGAKGEIALWALNGAVGSLIIYSTFNYNSWNPKEAVRSAGKGVLGGGIMSSVGGFLGGLFG